MQKTFVAFLPRPFLSTLTTRWWMSFGVSSVVLVLILFSFSTAVLAQEQGKASYYNNKFHGNPMASGKNYNRKNLTCAHRSYPFGTLLRVKNLKNDREVIVSVQDRGPYSRSRLIDLSGEAAKQLGMIEHGVVTVEIAPVESVKIPFLPEDPLQKFKEQNSFSCYNSAPDHVINLAEGIKK